MNCETYMQQIRTAYLPVGILSRKNGAMVARMRHEILGTDGYASPEQLGIAPTNSRTDIYAMGVLLNAMLTGQHPSRVLAKGKVGRIVLRCTQIDPGSRYQTAKQLMNSL
jgi:serine/threonine protein kinase